MAFMQRREDWLQQAAAAVAVRPHQRHHLVASPRQARRRLDLWVVKTKFPTVPICFSVGVSVSLPGSARRHVTDFKGNNIKAACVCVKHGLLSWNIREGCRLSTAFCSLYLSAHTREFHPKALEFQRRNIFQDFVVSGKG